MKKKFYKNQILEERLTMMRSELRLTISVKNEILCTSYVISDAPNSNFYGRSG